MLGCDHAQHIRLGWDLGWEGPHSCAAARAWHSPEALRLSLSQPASRNQGRGKDRTSPEWYFQGQWVESPP